MYKSRILNYAIGFAMLVVMLASGQAFAANYPLEIIQPRAGLDTKNRFYKAYPGIEYNVRLAVIGGAYPFIHSLTTAPSGMTINSNTGVITWPNPTTTSSPYTVTARVTDQEGTQTSVTWTVAVTTSGFIFVDAVNGNTGVCMGGSATGSIGSPFKTIQDWYCNSKISTQYQSQFVYYRAGTYNINAALSENCPGANCKIANNSELKPVVHMAYPGEAAIWNNGNAITLLFNGVNNLYLDGIKVINSLYYGVWLGARGDNVVVRRMNFDGLYSADAGSFNQSFIRWTVESGQTDYFVAQDNILQNLNGGAGIKMYTLTKALIEDNILHDFSDTQTGGSRLEGIALKQDIIRPTVRHNTCYNVPSKCIGGNMHSAAVTSSDFEILFNNCYNAANDCLQVNQDYQVGPVYVYRNTLQGRAIVLNSTSGTGPFYFSNNVIVNNDNVADHISCGGGLIGCIDASRIIRNNNLSGFPSTNIVDSNGNLTAAYLTYLGSRGYQINGDMPSPPQGLTVQ